MRRSGDNQPAVAEALTVFWPPLSEQRHITCLNNLQARVDIVKRRQATAALNALLPSILLDQALQGHWSHAFHSTKTISEVRCGNRANRKRS
jgi:hypothetical protein